MTLVIDPSIWHGNQVVMAAILQESGLCLRLVLTSLNTSLDVLVVFEEFRQGFLTDAFFVVKPLDPL
jgi:hypothetical protein